MIIFVCFLNEVVVGLKVVGCFKVQLQYLCGKNRVMERRWIKILTHMLHKPYIISQLKHIYYTFFQNSLREGLVQLFCPRQVIFSSEKVWKFTENYKRYGESLQRGKDITYIKSGKIINLI